MMDEKPDLRADLRQYLTGFAVALALTLIPFALVWWGLTDRATTLWVIAGLAIVQVTAHLRYFFHIDLSRQKREDLQLILFSLLILAMMAGGTIWIMANLAARMG